MSAARDTQAEHAAVQDPVFAPDPAAPVAARTDAQARVRASQALPGDIIKLQHGAGNAAIHRMLARENGSGTATAPPKQDPAPPDPSKDQMMPTEFTWQGLLREGSDLIRKHGWAKGKVKIESIVVVAGHVHTGSRDGEATGHFRKRKGSPRLPRGIYGMDRKGTYPIRKDGRAGAAVGFKLADLPEEYQKLKGIEIHHWVEVEAKQVDKFFPSPSLLMVVDVAYGQKEVEDEKVDPSKDRGGVKEPGFASEVAADPNKPPTGEAAPLPPLSAYLRGLESQPLGGTGGYKMEISWGEVSRDVFIAGAVSQQLKGFRWEKWKIEPTKKTEWRKKEALARQAARNKGERITRAEGFEQDRERKWRDFEEHQEEYAADKERALAERRYGAVVANELNEQLFAVEALTTFAGNAISIGQQLFTWENNDQKEVAWNEEGLWVIRCIADIDPYAKKEGRPYRPPSVAAKVVEVMDLDKLALEELGKGEALIAEQEQKIAEQFEIDKSRGVDPNAPSDDEIRLSDELLNLREQHTGESLYLIKANLRKKQKEFEEARDASPMLKVGARDRQVERLRDERDKLQQHADFASKRWDELRGGKAGKRKIYRLQANLASKITGQVYPLLLQFHEPQLYTDGLWRTTLSDVTTYDGGKYEGVGKTDIEAIWSAVDKLAGDDAGYGEGSLAVRLPQKLAGRDMSDPKLWKMRFKTFKARARDWKAAKLRLEELAVVLGLLALMAVPGVGAAGALIGAGIAAAHLYERWEKGTWRWDAAMVSDTLALLGGVTAVGGIVGKLRMIPVDGGRFVIVLAEEANKLGRAAHFLDTWFVNPGGLMWGNLSIINQLMEINKAESEGMLASEARRQRAQAFASAINTNMGLIGMYKGATGHPSIEKPASGKPGPIKEPIVKPVAKPGEPPPSRPVELPPTKPVEIPPAPPKPSETPLDAPTPQRPGEPPLQKPGEPPLQKPHEPPAAKPGEPPLPKPGEKPPPLETPPAPQAGEKPPPTESPKRPKGEKPLASEAIVERVKRQGNVEGGKPSEKLIKAVGDWRGELKSLVRGLPGKKAKAVAEKLAKAREQALSEEIAKVSKPPYEMVPQDTGSKGFTSDIDVTLGPKAGDPRPVHEQIRAAAEAAEIVSAALRKRFGGEPEIVADVAVHAYIGEKAGLTGFGPEIRKSGPQREQITAFEALAGFVESRRSMTQKEWAAHKEATLQALEGGNFATNELLVQAKRDLSTAMAQAEKFHGRMKTELAAQEGLVAKTQPELVGRAREIAARDLLLGAKRRQLADMYKSKEPDPVAIHRLAAEIRYLAPGAYVAEGAFHQAVRYGQERKGMKPGEFNRSWIEEKGLSPAEKRARLAASAEAQVGMFKSHKGQGDLIDQAKDAAKYSGRVLEALQGVGGSSDHPVAKAAEAFRSSKLADADATAAALDAYKTAAKLDPNTTPAQVQEQFVAAAGKWMSEMSIKTRALERGHVDAASLRPKGQLFEGLTQKEIDAAFDAATTPRVTGGTSNPRVGDKAVPTNKQPRLDIQDIARNPGESAPQALERVRQVLGKDVDTFLEVRNAWERARVEVTSSEPLTANNYLEHYDAVRKKFWRYVRADPAARQRFIDAGFVFPEGATTAPLLRHTRTDVPATEARVSLDHKVEKAIGDNWQRALDADNLRFELQMPNTFREIVQARHPELRQ